MTAKLSAEEQDALERRAVEAPQGWVGVDKSTLLRLLAEVKELRERDRTLSRQIERRAMGRDEGSAELLSENAQLAAHRDTLLAQVRAAEWRDIATAPQDGTPVIVCAGDIVGEARYIGEDGDEGWWWAGTDPGDYHASRIDVPVSHWQPLPPPPAREGSE